MIVIEGGDIHIDRISREALKKIKESMHVSARLLQRHIREDKLTGGTSSGRLRVRTGRLRASVRPLPVQVSNDQVTSGVSFGTVYGRVHVGPKGQMTIIRPKRAKWLTIPLPAVMTKAGVARGTARSFMDEGGTFGNTFIAKSKAGNLIIFGQRRVMKGKKMGELRSNIVPLFVLKKQVKIDARIHPKDLLQWIRPRMINEFIEKGLL